MKKIIIVTGSLGLGGLEKVVAKIANYYAEKQYEVLICCLFGSSKQMFVSLNKNVRVRFFNSNSKGRIKKIILSFAWIRFLRKVFNSEKPNFVLAMTLKIGALCAVAKGKNKFRLSFREINDPKSKIRNRFIDSVMFRFCKKVDGIIFQTDWEKSCYPRYLQIKGKVIPNPVSVDVIPCKRERDNIVVTTSRLDNLQKRHDILIKAFGIFLKSNPTYKLFIYGNGPDEEKYKKLIIDLKLQDNVFIKSAERNILSIICNAKMFVITSDFEGMSNALVEAMLLGVPCISSDWPGYDAIIKNNENGFVYKRQDVNELANFMNVLANNKQLGEQFSKSAMALSKHFDPAIVLAKYAEVIEGD